MNKEKVVQQPPVASRICEAQVPVSQYVNTFENVGQGQRLQNNYYLGSYSTDFNKTFTKMMQLGWQQKRRIS